MALQAVACFVVSPLTAIKRSSLGVLTEPGATTRVDQRLIRVKFAVTRVNMFDANSFCVRPRVITASRRNSCCVVICFGSIGNEQATVLRSTPDLNRLIALPHKRIFSV